jgi:hypothetical protein
LSIDHDKDQPLNKGIPMRKLLVFLTVLFALTPALHAKTTILEQRIDNCERIGYPEWRDDCLISLGKAAQNYALCLKFATKERQNQCFISNPPQNIEDCRLNKTDLAIDTCLVQLKDVTEDLSLCKKITTNQLRKECYSCSANTKDAFLCLEFRAKQLNDRSICDLIDVKSAKLACIASITAKTTVKGCETPQTLQELKQCKQFEIAQREEMTAHKKQPTKTKKIKQQKEPKVRKVTKKSSQPKIVKTTLPQAKPATAQKIEKVDEIPLIVEFTETNTAINTMKTNPSPTVRISQIPMTNEVTPAVVTQTLEASQTVKEITKAPEAKITTKAMPSVVASKAMVQKTSSARNIRAAKAQEKAQQRRQALKAKAQTKADKLAAIQEAKEAKAEKLQQAKDERAAKAQEKAQQRRQALEAKAQTKADKLTAIQEAKEAKAEKLQQAKDERAAKAQEKAQQRRQALEAKAQAKADKFTETPVAEEMKVRNFQPQQPAAENTLESSPTPKNKPHTEASEPGCTKGFGSWVEPPQSKRNEIACDKENIKEFEPLLNRCLTTERNNIMILSYDMNKDGCVTCADLQHWKRQVDDLYKAKKRSTNGKYLDLKACRERKF